MPASTPQDDPQYKVVKQVSDDFKAKYGKPVNQNSGSGWDAMLIMVTALEQGKVDPSGLQAGREALRTAIEGTKGLAGSIAVYDFSADQHGPTGIKGQAVLRVKGGAFVLEQAA